MFKEGSWLAVAEAIGRLPKLIGQNPNAPDGQLAPDDVRYLAALVAGGVLMSIENADPDYPQFAKVLATTLQYTLPAVDCQYTTAAVRGGATYRIHGHRGTARVFDVEVHRGHLSALSQWTLVDKLSEPGVADDGSVEIILSDEKRPGNCIRLPDGLGTVVVRQYFNDWETEEPGLLYIERLDARYPPPPLGHAAMAERLGFLQRWLHEVPDVCRRIVDQYWSVDPATIDFAPLTRDDEGKLSVVGWADVQYGRGNYRCAPDQAVVIEVPAPKAHYWNYQLTNQDWTALDWHLRKTSVNGHQAAVDPDGKLRIVISHRDPGVPNWLDTSTQVSGLIAVRYYRLAGDIAAHRLRVVPFERLRDELPAGTPTISPEERQAELRSRMLAARRTMRD